MAGSVNKVILVGNLGKDPEVRSFQNGGKSVSFPVATSESWKDKSTGERKDRTQWHNVVIFNENLGGVAERYLKKGAKVYLEGQLESRKYQDQSGQERYVTEVVLRQFRGELTLLDGKGESSGGGDYDRGERDSAPAYNREPAMAGAGAGGGSGRSAPAPVADLDDDIPF